MSAYALPDPEVLAALTAAVECCRHAIADYRAGLIDESELCDEVLGGGHLVRLRDAIDVLAAGGAA